VPRAL